MTTTNTSDLADAISVEIRRRIEAQVDSAQEWLEPFMDWCDRFIPLRDDFTAAVGEQPLGHVDGALEEYSRATGMDRVWLLQQLIYVETQRMEMLHPPALDDGLSQLVSR